VVKLELKLLADVGLVGFPNAGKSTIISVISAAKPKISDYPFTTLIPNLGIVHYSEYKSFVVADMPGLIEGAHVGKGLGILFLRHIERTHVLVLVIEATAPDLKEQHATLMEELKSFSKELVKRPRVVALTKMDLADQTLRRKVGKISFGRSVPVIPISAISGEGIRELVNLMWKKLHVNESRN
jgi:GTP-binding protein